jgi:hypothetical protein
LSEEEEEEEEENSSRASDELLLFFSLDKAFVTFALGDATLPCWSRFARAD